MTGIFPRLLAKSTPDPAAPQAGCSLLDHTLETTRAARAIVDATGKATVNALGLDGAEYAARLRLAAENAAFAHDLGKANDHFQRMVQQRQRDVAPQAHRHELLSLWLAGADGPLADWLFGGSDECVRAAVACAVAGHHLKLKDGLMHYAELAPSPLTLLGTHPDFIDTLEAGAARLNLAAPPAVGAAVFDADERTLEDACRPTLALLQRWLRRASPEERRFVAAVKALTVAADVVASAVVRGQLGTPNAGHWISSALASTCLAEELHAVAATRLDGHPPRQFQEETGASTAPITLVRAGCGSGKTVAAYLWAARRSVGRKLFVCYPTTGTATEGYADYLFGQEIESLLAHSRADVDLARLRAQFETRAEIDDLLENGEEGQEELAQQWASLDRALRVWLPKVVVCTVDTVLGLLQNYRGGLFSFPAIAEGAFVFDEIHLYDERMFSALLRFLHEFRGAPVLLMTASLQPHRREELERLCAQRGFTLPVLAGPEGLETGQRYTLGLGSVDDAVTEALATLDRDGKVLWVCNTVNAAMEYAIRLAGRGARPIVYHSRFRYVDRVERHREVVESFKRPGAVVAVTTQVCEVSLDLSADLLVSEIAPAPAMIQRLGRLNRRFDPEHPRQRPGIFIEPAGHLPYDVVDQEIGRVWLKQLQHRPVSQRDLAATFETLAPPEAEGARIQEAWLDTMPFAQPAPLRDGDGSVPIIRPEEEEACRGRRGRPIAGEIVRRAIPMPFRAVQQELGGWERIGMAFVPPAGRLTYSPEWGARWVAQK